MTGDAEDWAIAACALGAATADMDRDSAVADLVAAAAADADVLDQAQARVHGLKLGDDAKRRQAANLLPEVAVRVRQAPENAERRSNVRLRRRPGRIRNGQA